MDLDIGVPAGTQLPFGAPARRLGSSYSRRAVAKILWSYRLLWMWAAGKGCLSKGPDGLPGLVQDDRRTEKVWLAAVPGLAWCSGIRGKTLRACRCRGSDADLSMLVAGEAALQMDPSAITVCPTTTGGERTERLWFTAISGSGIVSEMQRALPVRALPLGS